MMPSNAEMVVLPMIVKKNVMEKMKIPAASNLCFP